MSCKFKRIIRVTTLNAIILLIYCGGCSNFITQKTFSPKSMTYVLQVTKQLGETRSEQLKTIRNANRDVIVMDYSANGDAESKWSRDEIDSLKRNGKTKVICYLSIGEAEDYRSYWEKSWNKNKPTFLCAENEDWKGNYKVKYWQKKWQKVIISYLDEIIDQGFDGIYLDIVDGFQFFEYAPEKDDWIDNRINPETKQTYRQDMIDFVIRLAKHARVSDKGFIVIPQNGSELLESKQYLSTIDAIGIEDMYTVGNKKQPKSHTQTIAKNLQPMDKLSKTVLLVEYPTTQKMRSYLKSLRLNKNYTLLLTDRPLKTLGETVTH